MKFIRKWSYTYAKCLSSKLNENHEKRSIYYFGFQIIIGEFVKLIILLALAVLLGVIKETLIILTFFVIFRTTAGGYHMDTYNKCMVASIVIFLLAGLFVHYTWENLNIHTIAFLNIATFFTGLFSFYKWAPADTPNKPIKKEEKIKSLKRKSILMLFITTIIIFFLIFKGLILYAMAACIGILVEIFNITPIGYSFYDMISGKKEHSLKNS